MAASEEGAAAIAGDAAASIYGVDVLVPHIEDDPNNTTRFWVLGRQKSMPSGRDETSLVMSAHNRPGAVHALLEPFAIRVAFPPVEVSLKAAWPPPTPVASAALLVIVLLPAVDVLKNCT